MTAKKALRQTPEQGYERLAFGGVADAVRLLFSSPEEYLPFEKMDLFNVEAIKRTKDGCTEVKFYDRIRALQCLESLRTEDGTLPLYRAIEEGARALTGTAAPKND